MVRKLQHGLSSIEAWCEWWYIKINEDKTQGIYFSHSLLLPVSRLTLNGRIIPFANNIKYLGVIFDKKITWRLHIQISKPRPSEHLLQYISYSKVSD
jgi:hypothetical protein